MATSFTFVHAADLHLDSPFSGLSRLQDWLAPILAEASLKAWDRLVEEALLGADFLVLAGDVFDHGHPSLRAVWRFRDGLRRLGAAGIPVFWAAGNHDHAVIGAAPVAWPDNVHRFPAGRPETERVMRDGRELCRVSGISYPAQAVEENYARLLTPDPAATFSIAVLHANVGQQGSHLNYAPAALRDLTTGGFDYWALGHIHHRTILSEEPWVVYPGNLQGRHPRECGRKGLMRVSVTEAGEIRPVFRPLNLVRWEVVLVDATGAETLEAVEDAAAGALNALKLDGDEEGAVVRLVLTGRTSLVDETRDWTDLAGRLSSDAPDPGFIFVESVTTAWQKPRVDAPAEGFWGEILAEWGRRRGPVESLGGPLLAGLPVDGGEVAESARLMLAELLEEVPQDAD